MQWMEAFYFQYLKQPKKAGLITPHATLLHHHLSAKSVRHHQRSGEETQPEHNQVVLDNCLVQKASGSLDCTVNVGVLSTQQRGVLTSQQSSGENQDKAPSSQQSGSETQCGCVPEMDLPTTEKS